MLQTELYNAITAAPERLYCDWVDLPGYPDIQVTAQPVRIDGDDGPIIPVSRRTALRVAEMLCGSLTTPDIEDAIWTHGKRLGPRLFQNDGTWGQALDWDVWADAALHKAGIKPGELVSFGDKVWLAIDSVSNRAANYGIHVPVTDCNFDGTHLLWQGMLTYPTASPTEARVVQPIAYAHNDSHADYSQHCRLWRYREKG